MPDDIRKISNTLTFDIEPAEPLGFDYNLSINGKHVHRTRTHLFYFFMFAEDEDRQKAEHKVVRDKILNTEQASEVRSLARSNVGRARHDWDSVKMRRLDRVIWTYLREYPPMVTALLATGNDYIRYIRDGGDAELGIVGSSKRGNLIGKSYMWCRFALLTLPDRTQLPEMPPKRSGWKQYLAGEDTEIPDGLMGHTESPIRDPEEIEKGKSPGKHINMALDPPPPPPRRGILTTHNNPPPNVTGKVVTIQQPAEQPTGTLNKPSPNVTGRVATIQQQAEQPTGTSDNPTPNVDMLYIPGSPLKFYHKEDKQTYYLTNFEDCVVKIWGANFKNSEHVFQTLKFLPARPDIAWNIFKADTARTGFDLAKANHDAVEAEWKDNFCNIIAMGWAIYFKFAGNPGLRQKLLDTKRRHLIEDAARDAFWGIGPIDPTTGLNTGQNILGMLLMMLRRWFDRRGGDPFMVRWEIPNKDGEPKDAGDLASRAKWLEDAKKIPFLREVVLPYVESRRKGEKLYNFQDLEKAKKL